MLGSSTNEGNAAHHANGVQASTSEDSGGHEQQRGQSSGLSNVETGPESILLNIASNQSVLFFSRDHLGNILVRMGVERSVHGANASNQAHTDGDPRVSSHQPIRPAAVV